MKDDFLTWLRSTMGRKSTTFLLEWEMDGQTWCMEIYADSWDDANKRLAAIRATGKIIGEAF